MPSLTITIQGEDHVLDHENTMIYMFPTRPEMNHVYITGQESKTIRLADGIIAALLGLGFLYNVQTYPRQAEIDLYSDWVVDQEGDLDDELEHLEGGDHED